MTIALALAAVSYLGFYLWAKSAMSPFTVRRVAAGWAVGWTLILAAGHASLGWAFIAACLVGAPALVGAHLGSRPAGR